MQHTESLEGPQGRLSPVSLNMDGPGEAHPAATTLAPGWNTTTHPDWPCCWLKEVDCISQVCWRKQIENQWSALTFAFTHEKTKSQIHQMTCPGFLRQLFIWRQYKSPENLCPRTHTLMILSLPPQDQRNRTINKERERERETILEFELRTPRFSSVDPFGYKRIFLDFRCLLPLKTRKKSFHFWWTNEW